MKEHDVGDAYRIGTPEQIDLAYDVAGLGSRFLAALVDTVIQTVLLVLIWFGSVSLVALLDGVGGGGGGRVGVVVVVVGHDGGLLNLGGGEADGGCPLPRPGFCAGRGYWWSSHQSMSR